MKIKNERITENNYMEFLQCYYKKKYKRKYFTLLSERFSFYFGILLLISSLLMLVLFLTDLIGAKQLKPLGITVAIYFIFMMLVTLYNLNAYDNFYKLHFTTQILIILQNISNLINNKKTMKQIIFLIKLLKYSFELSYTESKKNHLFYNTSAEKEQLFLIDKLKYIITNLNMDTNLSELNNIINKFILLVFLNCPEIILKNTLDFNSLPKLSELNDELNNYKLKNVELQETTFHNISITLGKLYNKYKPIVILGIVSFVGLMLLTFVLSTFEFKGIFNGVLQSLSKLFDVFLRCILPILLSAFIITRKDE